MSAPSTGRCQLQRNKNGALLAYTPEQREAAFWAKVDKSAGPEACWPWRGAITTHGYGCTQVGNKRVLGAHKVAYVYTMGVVPDGLQVCHTCDNRKCCNPSHFFLGTKADNARDAMRKDRHARGERNRRNKLTDSQVLEIRALAPKRGECQALAEKYGVNLNTMQAVVYRRTWRHLP